jgi:hypothetical protein
MIDMALKKTLEEKQYALLEVSRIQSELGSEAEDEDGAFA